MIAAATLAQSQQLSTSQAKEFPAKSKKLLPEIVSRMEQAQLDNRSTYRAYTLTREYRFYGANENEKPSSEVLADINFVPPDRNTFTIESSEGSSRGRGIVNKLLEKESKAAAEGKAAGAVTRDNYEFNLLGEDSIDGHACWILGLNPKRHEQDLIRGKAWVDKDTYLVRRMEGDMAKTPSWWLKRVSVVLDFRSAGGMWLKTNTRALADVRVFGPHSMVEQAVKIQTAEQVAQIAPASAQSRPSPGMTIMRTDDKAQPRKANPAQAFTGNQRGVSPLPAAPLPGVVGAGVLSEH